MDKMKSGDIYEIADVVRNLSFKQKEEKMRKSRCPAGQRLFAYKKVPPDIPVRRNA